MNRPFDCQIALYDVHRHAMQDVHGYWLRYRRNGWAYYPMQIRRPYERGLHMARFRGFAAVPQQYDVSVLYVDPVEDETHFEGLINWIGMRQTRWNFHIDGGGRLAERDVHFSFSNPVVAVEFKLTYA